MEIRATSSPVLQRKVFGIHVLLSLLSKDSSFTFLVRGSLEVFAVLPQGDEPLFAHEGEAVFLTENNWLVLIRSKMVTW